LLKRYQVLLNDWLADFIKCQSERYDVSFSEVIRLMLCCQLENLVRAGYPKYKFGISMEYIVKELRRGEQKNKLLETHRKLMSKIYFESRKATEYILAADKKSKRYHTTLLQFTKKVR